MSQTYDCFKMLSSIDTELPTKLEWQEQLYTWVYGKDK